MRKKARSFLTTLGIMIGIASVILVLSIGKGSEAYIENELNSLGMGGLRISAEVEKTGIYHLLYEKDLKLLEKQVDEIKSMMPLSYRFGKALVRTKSLDAIVWGVGSNLKDVIPINMLYGRLFNQTDIQNKRSVCIVNGEMAKKIYGRENIVGKTVLVNTGGQDLNLEIIGIAETQSSLLESMAGDYIPAFIYTPYTTVQQSLGTTVIEQIAVKVKEGQDVDQTGKKIVSVLQQYHNSDGYFAENLAKQKKQLNNIINVVTLTISAVAGISLLVGGIGIMTLMLVSVNERTHEIGIKKSIGARNGDIMLEFLIEAIMLTGFGCFFGAILGVGSSYLAAAFFKLPFSIHAAYIGFALLFSLLIGGVFGVYPANQAAKQEPVQALKG